jgi:anaerobic magnesium-protoporphyrin IX monomethyl ester cyclase
VRVLLINPPTKYVVQPCVYPPIGLGYVAAAFRRFRPNWTTDLLDCAGAKPATVVNTILDGLYDIVGFTGSSLYWKDTENIVRSLRASAVRTPYLIAGGPHVTLTKDYDSNLWDTVFVGVADLTVGDFCDDFDNKKPHSIYMPRQCEPDDLPIPIAPLGANMNVGGAGATAVLYTSFGCTHNCVFCAARAMYPRVKFRSIDHVMKEIDHYVKLGVKSIRFMDDAFTMSIPRVSDLCARLKPLGLSWGCMARVDQVGMNILDEMKASGCTEVAFGIESFDQNVLDVVGKKVLVSRNAEALKLAYESGLAVEAFIMTGAPGESVRTAKENIFHLKYHEHVISKLLLQTFMPYPGCAVWKDPKAHGIEIVDFDVSKYNAHQYMRGVDGEVCEVPIWSPHRIKGLTYYQQLENHRMMREYCISTSKATKGIYK